MPKPPPTAVASSNSLPKEGSFAYKQMLKMGWKPDSGLGKDGSGISTAITAKRRRDGEALGGGGDRGQVSDSGFLLVALSRAVGRRWPRPFSTQANACANTTTTTTTSSSSCCCCL